MPSLNLFVVLAVAMAFVVVGILLFPNVKRAKGGKKRRHPRIPEEENKNWKMVGLRLEKHIYTLRKEIAVFEKRGKTLEKELAIQKEKYEKVQSKLSQERGWQSKDTSDKEKKAREVVLIKKTLKDTEQTLTDEHGMRLRLEKMVKEMNKAMDESREATRVLETQVTILKSQGEGQRKEISELRTINQRLSRKHDDATWIAKSEYVKLERNLKAEIKDRERELARLKTILRKEGFEE